MLNEWDPIGCSPPPDEYDCMLKPLLGKLDHGCDVTFLARFLTRFLKDDMGLDGKACGVDDFAHRVLAWYQERRIR